MNDWHKPALDGIGYQDSLNGERAWWTDYIKTNEGPLVKTAAGKTVAWINYRDWETLQQDSQNHSCV